MTYFLLFHKICVHTISEKIKSKYLFIKKADIKPVFFCFGALLFCDYRTENYDEYKQLGDKLTMVFVYLYKCPYT